MRDSIAAEVPEIETATGQRRTETETETEADRQTAEVHRQTATRQMCTERWQRARCAQIDGYKPDVH